MQIPKGKGYPKADARWRQHGFTLMEVMITVAIIAILSAIAYPAYTDHLRRGQLQEAFAALPDYRIKLEQYFQDHKNYGTAVGGVCADGPDAPSWGNFNPGAKFFSFSCTVTPGGYILKATGAGGLAVGHVFTVSETNAQRTTLFKGAVVDKSCWLARGSEC